MKILIAEDDDVSRLLLRGFLESPPENHLVIETATGNEAWGAINAHEDIDVCIFDVMMPDVSGLDLLTRLRRSPTRANLPVVLCTALQDRVTVARALSLKVTQYLVKPFTRAKVLDRIHKAVQQASAEQWMEPVATVCARLQISPEVYRTLLDSIGKSTTAWLAESRKLERWASVSSLGTRANALKGASLNLGLTALAALFTQAEELCLDQYTLAEKARATQSPVSEGALGDITAVVNKIETELGRVKTTIEKRDAESTSPQ
jgi:CheY-like chemotaxis protein/HPt (histidine-containing phosphotransfer) domain-containing protein